MSENLIPEEVVNFADKSLSQLSDLFKQLMDSADRMTRSKEAESIKSSFYKLLLKLKSEASESADEVAEMFDGVEENFKSLYADYKRERAEFNRQQEAEKAENLTKKQIIIDELKALVESQEDVNFPAFRELQDRWRAVGQVPATNYRDINDTYQFYVEKFYDMVKIGRDLRDLDFKKNLEAKQAFCEAAEKLAENENIVSAFNELQKLHEQWKDFGPVAKEFREDIWNRFKAATAVINKRYQAHFEEVKGQMAENLAAKEKLCEKVEEVAAREVKNSAEWNAFSKEIEDIQAEWRKIGFATKKENQKIYDRFRAACDDFYGRKREFYNGFKSELEENLQKKMSIIERAEELKSSTEWKKTADQFIALQKEWKEIGAVPRKKSEQLWKRFRAACDEFFAERDKNAKPENNFYANLKAKKSLIEEIKAIDIKDATEDLMKEIQERWNAIGFVPFKEKEGIAASFKEVMSEKFPQFSQRNARRGVNARALSPKEELVRKFNALQQDIETYENNIGFFAASKNSAPLIKQMEDRISAAKEELKELEQKIRKAEEEAE